MSKIASPSLKSWVAILAVLISGHAAATDLVACRAISEDAARLACYDAIELAGQQSPAARNVPAAIAAKRPLPPVAASPAPSQAPNRVASPEPMAAATSPQPDEASADDFGRELVLDDDATNELVARIAGPFSGWSGNTRFVLDNGQIWQQDETGKLNYKGPDNPQVTIKRGFMSSYRLKIEGRNTRIKVKRVK